jgi:hypothetical protein
MTARYGILVQMAQLIAQLFLDWMAAQAEPADSFSFLVPAETVENAPTGLEGFMVTVTPMKRPRKPYRKKGADSST